MYNNNIRGTKRKDKLMTTFYTLLQDSITFYSQFGWSKQKTYIYLKDNFLRYKNVKYIQNKKHGSTVHFKQLTAISSNNIMEIKYEKSNILHRITRQGHKNRIN